MNNPKNENVTVQPMRHKIDEVHKMTLKYDGEALRNYRMKGRNLILDDPNIKPFTVPKEGITI